MNAVQKHLTSAGRTIFSFPVTSFPSLVNNIHVIDDGDRLILVDCGSGMDSTNEELRAGFAAIGEQFNTAIGLSAIDIILVTHGHIDHFGGLPFVRQFTDAPVGVHVLDRRVLSNYEERVLFASRRLETFLESAGVAQKHVHALMGVYLFAKNIYRSIPVSFLLEDGQTTVSDIKVWHVPGHCPGQVCLQIDDVLLTADHVLSYTTPHQAPESITNNMGLGHYLASLDKIQHLDGVRIGLGGHEAPLEDISGRIQEIKQVHQVRLERVLNICQSPKSIADISRELFGRVESYHVLLALEETGAHVEYLYQRGELVAANLGEIEEVRHPVVKYVQAAT